MPSVKECGYMLAGLLLIILTMAVARGEPRAEDVPIKVVDGVKIYRVCLSADGKDGQWYFLTRDPSGFSIIHISLQEARVGVDLPTCKP